MRKQMKALEEKNVTYMKETMNLQEVNSGPLLCLIINIFPLFIDNLLNSFINMYCISSFYI